MGNNSKHSLRLILTIVCVAFFLATVFVTWVYPDIPTARYFMGACLLICTIALGFVNKKVLKQTTQSRNFKYGTNAVIQVFLVLSILLVLNVLNYHQFYRKDLSAAKSTELSEQTIKILKEIKSDIKVTVFNQIQARDESMGFLKNYIYVAGSKLKTEFVDVARDPSRARAMKISKAGTVVIETNGKESRIEELNEEKFTNALIKLLKNKNVTVCFVKGHGEKDPERSEADGLSQVKQTLVGQNYEVKTISLIEEAQIPNECSLIAVIGPNKAFLDKEIDSLKKYLDNGGKALFGLDPNLREGKDFHPEMNKLLNDWFITVNHNLVIDLTSKLLGASSDMSVITEVNQTHSIMKDVQPSNMMLFPAAHTVEIRTGAPATLQTWWLGKTSNRAFLKTDFNEIKTGKVSIDTKKDKPGPHTLMVAVEGKRDEKNTASSSTRIVVMGSSNVAVNQFARIGSNVDLVVNSMSWLANDESLISIRKKDEQSQAFSLTQAEARFIQYMILFILPGTAAALGIFNWYRRRRL